MPQTLFIGNEILKLEEVDSTNTFALDLLRNSSATEGTVVIAKTQNSGRGQRGNSWNSEAGKNLTCSIILKPTFLSVNLQFDLTRAVALGITDLLSILLPESDIKIKWPNDIYVDGKKMGGILIENMLNGNQISNSVVGIGLNVNQSDFGNTPNATSIFLLTKLELDVTDFSKLLFSYLEARYLQLRGNNVGKLRNDYETKLFRKNIPANYSDFKNVFEATLENVTDEGLLVLKLENGEERKFGFKEVGFL